MEGYQTAYVIDPAMPSLLTVLPGRRLTAPRPGNVVPNLTAFFKCLLK